MNAIKFRDRWAIDVFGFRYCIQSKLSLHPLQRVAVDVTTGRKVLLKFYPRLDATAFHHVLSMHQRTRDNVYVCKFCSVRIFASNATVV